MSVELSTKLEKIVSAEASKDPAFDALAAQVEAAVKAQAPVDSGDYIFSIKRTKVRTKQGITDRVIYTDDPQAHIIEWGYLSKKGTWVPGKFVFRTAARTFQ